MKIGLIVIIIIFSNDAFGQFKKFIGTWLTPNNEFIEVNDTSNNSFSKSNSIEIKGKSEGLEIYLFGDTLSFQRRDYNGEEDSEKLKIDRYDLKVLMINETNLIVKPVSKLSRLFFKDKKILTFTKQELAIDKSIKFEKLKFHSSSCMFTCPTYHLEIDKNKKVKIYAERVFKEYFPTENDSTNSNYQQNEISVDNEDSLAEELHIEYIDIYDRSKEGCFSGELSDSSYNRLINLLQTCNLRTIQFSGEECCDGSIITIIVYYNGQRKYLKSMFPPCIASKLIVYLYNLCKENKFVRTNEKFEIEE